MDTTASGQQAASHPPLRRIGQSEVHPVGLGLVAFTFEHADDPARALQTITTGLEAGIQLVDTALAYTTATDDNHNERLVARALQGVSPADRPLISTKGGHYRSEDTVRIDGRPETLRRHCEASLRALQVERIDLYHLHWPDPDVPITESVGALADLQREGKIDLIGLSNVDVHQLAQAQDSAGIAAVQNPYSFFSPGDQEVLAHCERHGIAFLAHSPLRGMTAARASLARTLDAVAAHYDATKAQIALAWLLAQAPSLVAISGATRAATVRDSAAAARLTIEPEHLNLLNRLASE
ncbi:aldo/keto reductase [Streptomyces fractus]|uniref:aldo/keto reductase n=1 Tax=Streptomyces fractus TaxID=641806 RepID=UPI003CF68550